MMRQVKPEPYHFTLLQMKITGNRVISIVECFSIFYKIYKGRFEAQSSYTLDSLRTWLV